MFNMPLSKGAKLTLISGKVAAGTSTITPTRVDMTGFGAVMFLIAVGTSATDIGAKVQQGAATGMGDAADLEGSLQLLDGTEKQIILDVRNPEEQYVRPAIVRTTSTEIEGVWALQYMPRDVPIDNNTAAQAVKLLERPAEGTA